MNSEVGAPGRSSSAWMDAGLILSLGFMLYVSTLAPTVLWGDDAELQRLAWSGGETNPGRGHSLWLVIARAFDALPWGDPARRANLVSAVFGALTLPLIYACVFTLTRRRDAACLAARIGRVDRLNRGLRPCSAAAPRTRSINRAVSLSGSPHSM